MRLVRRLLQRTCPQCGTKFDRGTGSPGLFTNRETYCRIECLGNAWREDIERRDEVGER
jgi:hypothetical protein